METKKPFYECFKDILAFVNLRVAALEAIDTNTQPTKSVKAVNVADETHTPKKFTTSCNCSNCGKNPLSVEKSLNHFSLIDVNMSRIADCAMTVYTLGSELQHAHRAIHAANAKGSIRHFCVNRLQQPNLLG